MKPIIITLLSLPLVAFIHGNNIKPLNSTVVVKQTALRATIKPSEAILAAKAKIVPVTPKTTPASAPTPVASPAVTTAAPVSDGCYTSLLQQYSWNWQIMLAIEKTESGCNPNSVSPPDYDGLSDYGLLQLHGQAIFDPATNISVAYQKWLSQGYGAWSSYNSRAYEQNL